MSDPMITPEHAIRAMQIIASALIIGVVAFGLVAVFMLGAVKEPADGFILSLMGAVFAAGAFVMHLIVPGLMKDPAGGDAAAAGELIHYQRYQARLIVGMAMLEGTAFFNIIATIVEHNWWSLAIAGALVFWMLAMFPTQTRVQHWVETQRLSCG